MDLHTWGLTVSVWISLVILTSSSHLRSTKHRINLYIPRKLYIGVADTILLSLSLPENLTSRNIKPTHNNKSAYSLLSPPTNTHSQSKYSFTILFVTSNSTLRSANHLECNKNLLHKEDTAVELGDSKSIPIRTRALTAYSYMHICILNHSKEDNSTIVIHEAIPVINSVTLSFEETFLSGEHVVYSLRARTENNRPVNSVPVQLQLSEHSLNDTTINTEVITDVNGLAQGSIPLSELKSDDTSKIRNYRLTATHLNSSLNAESLISDDPHSESQWLYINLFSDGYIEKHEIMIVTLLVRIPGVEKFSAKASINYCIKNTDHCNNKETDIKRSETKLLISLPKKDIDKEQTTRNIEISFNVTIIEQESGITQHHRQTLPLYNSVRLLDENIRTEYELNQTLHAKNIKISSPHSSTVKTVDATNIHLSNYSAKVNDVITVSVKSNHLLFFSTLLIKSCDGRLLKSVPITSLSISLIVTGVMFPCALISVEDYRNNLISTAKLIVQPPIHLNVVTAVADIRPGSEVQLKILSDLLNYKHNYMVNLHVYARGIGYPVPKRKMINSFITNSTHNVISHDLGHAKTINTFAQTHERNINDCNHEHNIQLESEILYQSFQLHGCDRLLLVKVRLPEFQVSDFVIRGEVNLPDIGLVDLGETVLLIQSDVVIAVKHHTEDLVAADEFHVNVAVFSNLHTNVKAVIRLMFDFKDAFCFQDMLLNSYPHKNNTLQPGGVTTAQFVATALKPGDYTINVEVLGEGVLLARKTLKYHVALMPFLNGKHMTDIQPDLQSSNNVKVKMRYEKSDNLRRCNGFRLTAEIQSAEITTESPTYGIFDSIEDDSGNTRQTFLDKYYDKYYNRKRKRRRADTIQNYLQNTHHRPEQLVLKVCYRIQKSSAGPFYIDVESFSGLTPLNPRLTPDPDSEHCNTQGMPVMSYKRGTVLVVDNNFNNQSSCCFQILMTQDSPAAENSAGGTVRISNRDRPGDFCLEFYSTASTAPYSNHICSREHGCLCTENGHSSCKNIREGSKLRSMLKQYALLYADSKFAVTARVVNERSIAFKDYIEDTLEILQSFGHNYIEPGTRLHVYQKNTSKCLDSIQYNNTILIMGTQLYLNTGNELTLYLDNSVTVINIEESDLNKSDNYIYTCFMDSLLCPAQPTNRTTLSSIKDREETITNIMYNNDNVINPADIQNLQKLIYTNCRTKSRLLASGITETQLQEAGLRNSCDYHQVVETKKLLRKLRRKWKYKR